MAKIELPYTHRLDVTLGRLAGSGLLLTSLDRNLKPNVMTIGWGTIGVVWGKPIFTVLVRPSRYTYGCIEATGDFTVNVPTPGMEQVTMICGSRSGREKDKFAECKITPAPGKFVKSPTIAECEICYECVVVNYEDIRAGHLAEEIMQSAYPNADLHRVYYGEILGTFAEK
ncbi:MAG TPA: flavin reductase family protein [bacterium]|nr:flavin reductase family protein [bacterium]